jgi:predicted aspartyl protease
MGKKHPQFLALTLTASGGRLSELRSECRVCAAFDPATTPQNIQPPFEAFGGIWDTGASGTFITQRIITKCGLKPFTMVDVQGAYGGVTQRNVYLINLLLPSGVHIPNVAAIEGEMGTTDMLIGMDVITLGDFAITNFGGNTVFSFRIPSHHTIDYVRQANQINASAANPPPKKKRKKRR